MALKKKTKKVFFIVIGILAFLLILNHFGVFEGEKPLAIVPIDDFPIETSSPYVCPLGVTQCKVSGGIDCFNAGSPPRVIFRTNAENSSDYTTLGTWIAFDLGAGLKSYVYNGQNVAWAQSCSSTPANIVTPHGNKVINADSNILYVCSGGRRYSYPISEGADLTNIPKEPYTSNNQEITSGALYIYNCYGTLEIRDNQNQVIYSNSINYNSNNPGSKNDSYPQTIYPGYTVKLISTTSSNNHLWYGTYEEKQSCSKDVCNLDSTGFYQCKNGIVNYNNLTYCLIDNGFVCQLGVCTFPFTTKEIKFVDINRFEKTGFSPNETIQVSTKLLSSTIPYGNVDLKIFKYGDTEPTITESIDSYNFQSGQTVYTNLGKITSTGLYYLIVEITYNGQTIQIGTDKSYTFRIAPKINCNVNIKSPDRTSLFINSPVWVEVNTYDAIGPAEVDEIILDVKFNNQNFYIDPTSFVSPPIASGNVLTYRFITQFPVVGTLDVSAKVKKSGVESSTSTMSKTVQSISIKTEFTNLNLFSCISKGTQTLTFESKDSFGIFVNTINSLKVVEPDTTQERDISDLIEPVDTGKYKFTFNFDKESAGGNGYVFKLVSSSPEYNIGSEPRSGTIEVRSGCSPAECVSNADCSSRGINYICNSGKCEESTGSPNWLLYLGIGIGVLVLLIVIVFIFKFWKKPNQNVYTGLEGL